jgi:CheY-like chemotaxis protein
LLEDTLSAPIEILLVEDNPGDIRLTQEVLKEGKVHNTLSIVENGVQAISFLRKESEYQDAPTPDLILLDLNLPKKDGREVLLDIKNDPELKKIPVVVLTTSQSEEDILKVYDLNANCYISKPVDFGEFIDVVKSIENFWLSIVKLPTR